MKIKNKKDQKERVKKRKMIRERKTKKVIKRNLQKSKTQRT
jgi:hypothetical protein